MKVTLARACVNLKSYFKEPIEKVNIHDRTQIHANNIKQIWSPQLYPLGHGPFMRQTVVIIYLVGTYSKEHGDPWLYDSLISTVKVTNLMIYHVIVDSF